MRPLAVFLAIYIININSPSVFAARKFDTLVDADFDAFTKGATRKSLDIKNRAKMPDFL